LKTGSKNTPRFEQGRRLFRRAFRKADRKAGDLKHLVANLLPAPLYRNLLDLVTRRYSVRIEGKAESSLSSHTVSPDPAAFGDMSTSLIEAKPSSNPSAATPTA
jgi:hypothetical protein